MKRNPLSSKETFAGWFNLVEFTCKSVWAEISMLNIIHYLSATTLFKFQKVYDVERYTGHLSYKTLSSSCFTCELDGSGIYAYRAILVLPVTDEQLALHSNNQLSGN